MYPYIKSIDSMYGYIKAHINITTIYIFMSNFRMKGKKSIEIIICEAN